MPAVPATPGFPVAAEISDALGEAGRGCVEPARRYLGERALEVERQRQSGQRPMVASELDPANGQRVLGLVIQ